MVQLPLHQTVAPWQALNFLPLPQGQGALRGVFAHSSFTTGACLVAVGAAAAWAFARAAGSTSPDAAADCAAARMPSVGCVSLEDCCTFWTIGAGSSLRTTCTCITYFTKSCAMPFISDPN